MKSKRGRATLTNEWMNVWKEHQKRGSPESTREWTSGVNNKMGCGLEVLSERPEWTTKEGERLGRPLPTSAWMNNKRTCGLEATLTNEWPRKGGVGQLTLSFVRSKQQMGALPWLKRVSAYLEWPTKGGVAVRRPLQTIELWLRREDMALWQPLPSSEWTSGIRGT